MVVEDLEQFGKRNGPINEEAELDVSFVLFSLTETHIVGDIVFRVVVSDYLVSLIQAPGKAATYSAGQSRPATSTSSHRSRFGKQKKVDTTSSVPYSSVPTIIRRLTVMPSNPQTDSP